MNWLAHLLLSEPTAEFRLGNLLPDLLGAEERKPFDGDFRRGIECHLMIDRFTDAHPVVRQSKQRLRPTFGKLAGVAVDIFYDHILARDWDRFAAVPLRRFTREVYEDLAATMHRVPLPARGRLERMCEDDWITAYGRLAGVQRALRRVSSRLRTPLDLEDAIRDLGDHDEGLVGDFEAFFPQLHDHVAAHGIAMPCLHPRGRR